MATKKKTKTKRNSKKTKQRSAKKSTLKKKTKAGKSPKKSVTKKRARKKATVKRRTAAIRTAPKKRKKKAVATEARPARSTETSQPFIRDTRRSRLGEASGDSQGLSRRESADSESVDELLAEGNAFEAEVVQGVEEAGDDAESEVRTHEVSEDDIPEEYLDSDK